MDKKIIIRSPFPQELNALLKQMYIAGFFDSGLLVGSWVFLLFQEIFDLSYPLRTFDVDFAVAPVKNAKSSDLESLIISLGFLPVTAEGGWRKYTRKGFAVEFLTHRKGSRDGVDLIKAFNISALRLPFLDILFEEPLVINIEDFKLKIPCPESLFLHKLITAGRRVEKDKGTKDLEQCNLLVSILDYRKLQLITGKRRWSRAVNKVLRESCDRIGFSYKDLGI